MQSQMARERLAPEDHEVRWHAARERSGRRSYHARLVYVVRFVDREYSAERRLNMAQLVSRTYDC